MHSSWFRESANEKTIVDHHLRLNKAGLRPQEFRPFSSRLWPFQNWRAALPNSFAAAMLRCFVAGTSYFIMTVEFGRDRL